MTGIFKSVELIMKNRGLVQIYGLNIVALRVRRAVALHLNATFEAGSA
jgi:hypothetical protein